MKTSPTFAVFIRATGTFLAFMKDTPQDKMNHGGHDHDWVALSAGQIKRIGALTDGDDEVNATAKNLGRNKARIYAC